MKKKLSKLRSPYFFGQRNPAGTDSSGNGNMPELIKLESVWERAESGIEDILRWADDGGQMTETGSLMARSNPDTAREEPNEDGCQRKRKLNRNVSGNHDPKFHVS